MERNKQSKIVIGIGVLIFLVGTLLNVLMLIAAAWPTYLYFLVMAVGLVVILLGIWARQNWIFRNRPVGFLKRNIVIVAILFLAGAFVAWMNLIDVKRRVTHEMIWSYGEPDQHGPTIGPDTKLIVLRFVNYPNRSIGIYSRDLGAYLESLPSNRVPVVFEVTYDFGEARGFTEIQIGDLKKWDSQWGYNRLEGDAGPSPWD